MVAARASSQLETAENRKATLRNLHDVGQPVFRDGSAYRFLHVRLRVYSKCARARLVCERVVGPKPD